jgi:hypothetical protein
MNRGMDADAGGAADLQTDVMRFMAIISMCLVAIFALVQSIPLAPVPAPPAGTPVEPAPVETPVPAPETAKALTLTRPTPPPPVKKDVPVMLERPSVTPAPAPKSTVDRSANKPPKEAASASDLPAPADTRSPDTDDQQTSAAGKAQKGFTLRFESDAALKRLVARDIVGLYAISARGAQRMNVSGATLNFWNASVPQRFHEMDAATVPADVLMAYRRGSATDGVKWGVSLPSAMSGQLNGYLSEQEGGSLVIGEDGTLRLEP